MTISLAFLAPDLVKAVSEALPKAGKRNSARQRQQAEKRRSGFHSSPVTKIQVANPQNRPHIAALLRRPENP